MNKGTKVVIARTNNKFAAHLVGKTGVIIGDAPLGMVTVKLDGGAECYFEKYNLKTVA